MNRYRTLPGLGPAKASATTTCQKCLKKDSYECKSTTQERPYITRPSRTQQLLNPKLKPRLASDQENGLMRTRGVADEELSRAQAARESATKTEEARRSRSPEPRKSSSRRKRSTSASSYDSISTISTSKSESPRPDRSMSPDPAQRTHRGRDHNARSRSTSRPRKRKQRDSSLSRSPLRFESTNKSRRYRSSSPEDRGRPTEDRRGSNRGRSRGLSSNRSEITKQRRSMDDQIPDARGEPPEERSGHGRQSERYGNRPGRPPPPVRKERSLSPYSRRLALTQAMNMGR